MIFLFSIKKHFKIIEQRNDIFKMNMKKPSQELPTAPHLHVCTFHNWSDFRMASIPILLLLTEWDSSALLEITIWKNFTLFINSNHNISNKPFLVF